MSLEEELNQDELVGELKRTIVRLQRDAKRKADSRIDLVTATYQAARDAATVVGVPKSVIKPTRSTAKNKSLHPLLHLTDWQLGKKTESYDSEVAVRRVRHVISRVRVLADIQRHEHPINEITVMFGGDHMEGLGIFPGQAYEVDSTAYQQLMTCAALQAEVILALLEDFQQVHVRSVPGNHGRLGRKGDMPKEDNLDLISYALARAYLGKQTRVDWPENLRWYDHIEIGKYNAILIHGDQVRGSSAGTPIAPLQRKATQWAAGGGPRVEWFDMYLGHYHQNIVSTLPSGGQVRMTPSTESDSIYASETMAASGRPGQRLMFIHPDKGWVISEQMIWLDDVH